MWKSLSLWIAGIPLLLGILLLLLCLTAAGLLYWHQDVAATALKENLRSNQAAHDLENTLDALAALLREGDDQVSSLQARAAADLARVTQLVDKPEGRELVQRIQKGFDHFLQLRHERPSDLMEAARVLDAETLPACNRLQAFNNQVIQAAQEEHQALVGWMAAGLVAVSTVGAATGALMGYMVARRLRHQVARLSVRIQDAASKLAQDLPEVSLTAPADLEGLQQQMRMLVAEIEAVVTRLQQREHEVLRAEQLAAVGQLAAGVAHELRNPLTSIKLLVQTNKEDAQAHGLAAEDLDVIEHEVRRMERCLQSFLDFARPPQPQRRPTDLRQPIQRTLALVAARARKQHVQVAFHDPAESVVADADAEQIQHLLVNLVLNALDMMPSGGTLDVQLSRHDGCAELRVGDTGPGISDELMPKLFSPFVSTKETGLGLGLVIARRIAEAHGGSLRAANRPEGGAMFTLRLPARTPHGEPACPVS